MNRRTLLAATGVSLTVPVLGCLQDDDSGTSDDRNNDTNQNNQSDNNSTEEESDSAPTCEEFGDTDKTDNEPGKGFPAVSVEPDKSDSEYIDVSVAVLRHFDDEAPARIRITLMNTDDERRSFDFLDIRPFAGLTGYHTEYDDSLIIDPEDGVGDDYPEERPTEPSNGCWMFPTEGIPINDVLRGASLDACETYSNEYDLYGHPDNEECLRKGEYRFESGTTGSTTHRWGFSLFVE